MLSKRLARVVCKMAKLPENYSERKFFEKEFVIGVRRLLRKGETPEVVFNTMILGIEDVTPEEYVGALEFLHKSTCAAVLDEDIGI